MKITAVCGNGLGTSLLISMNIKAIVEELKCNCEVNNIDLSSVSFSNSNLYVMGVDIANSCQVPNKIILENLIDKGELKTKLLAWLQEHTYV